MGASPQLFSTTCKIIGRIRNLTKTNLSYTATFCGPPRKHKTQLTLVQASDTNLIRSSCCAIMLSVIRCESTDRKTINGRRLF